ncbi:misacylated tRNA(Ala) deacylase [Meinhardsimonia xiamenensis]|jgi:misacylated tRNA(Ala) deacylase|uniref:Misacylated tRNA(Ala) deacylase n=1 Tax=Meinhardsimonia xiamenensis TaxID=990712 RepID=A0A1G9G2C5_9RHOB|nr:alanyl-tRNA editing protein [Meinhardsimonia xiamenensis]PRX32708.1 Ala-tRNA(Pro) hydrolase [Meinhardsimonia xiamenensis]SDK94852.1 misacylated tRNA(Ala) deacylase [Meinhardsimonia xiamenensis]
MTEPLYHRDAYAREALTRVAAVTEEGAIIPEASIFFPRGGGQPGDSGVIRWEGGAATIADTVKGEGGAVLLIPAEGAALPRPGAEIHMELDWVRRHAHMRVHTALHLLSVVIPLPVTGGAISAGKGRLDFDMPEAPQDRDALEEALNALVGRDLEVREEWITDAELAANPGLVKTMSVMPPMGQGRVRLIRIGDEDETVDLQPCGGTHVARTGEIGPLRLGKIEKKGRQNRRVTVHLLEN